MANNKSTDDNVWLQLAIGRAKYHALNVHKRNRPTEFATNPSYEPDAKVTLETPKLDLLRDRAGKLVVQIDDRRYTANVKDTIAGLTCHVEPRFE